MGRLVHRHNEFVVIENDYKPGHHIIINTKGDYSCHGHVKHLSTCKKILKLMDKKIVPYSTYLRGTVLRISLDKSYIEKVKHKVEKDAQKPKFYRVQKGVVRK